MSQGSWHPARSEAQGGNSGQRVSRNEKGKGRSDYNVLMYVNEDISF